MKSCISYNKQIKNLVFSVFLSFVFIGNTQAEPSLETRWLMNEPLSLFDMGMYRANITVEKALRYHTAKVNELIGAELFDLDRPALYFRSVKYDWESDRINIKWSIYYRIKTQVSLEDENGFVEKHTGIAKNDKNRTIDTQDKLNKLCFALLSGLAGNTFGQSASWDVYGMRHISRHFGHAGYMATDEPEDVYRKLASKITYKVSVQHDTFFARDEKRNTELRPMRCEIGYDNPLETSSPMYIDIWKGYMEGDR